MSGVSAVVPEGEGGRIGFADPATHEPNPVPGFGPAAECPLRGDSFDAAAFGGRIKALRALRKLSLEEVAEASGFTKSHVWGLETGRSRNPTVRAVWSLARALGVTPAHMLGLNPDGLALHPTAMEVACIVDRALNNQSVMKTAEEYNPEVIPVLVKPECIFNYCPTPDECGPGGCANPSRARIAQEAA